MELEAVSRPRAALSIDVEDWFCVRNLRAATPFASWESCEPRLSHGLDFILRELARRGTKATFFVLGWIAERHPETVRAIAEAGHEIGTHGYSHRGLDELSAGELREELRRSVTLLETLTGRPVLGFRAPSFSVTGKTLWAMEVLRDCGIRYDSSIFPVRHPNYGIPSYPMAVRDHDGVVEVPLTAAELGGLRLPVAGGGFFRLYPYRVTRYLLRRTLRAGRDVVMYFHPWEFDPGQPRIGSLKAHQRFRHYVGLGRSRAKFRRLLDDFDFMPISRLIAERGYALEVR